MSDLSSLMNIAPTSAAFMAGGNNALGQQQTRAETDRLRALIQELQTRSQLSQEMHPLKMEEQRLTNQGLQAGLPGIVADASSKQSGAALKAGTLPSDIQAGNSKNKTDITNNTYKERASFMAMLGAELSLAEDTPGAGAMAASNMMQKWGVPPDSQDAQTIMKSIQGIPAKKAGALLMNQAQQMYLNMNEHYQGTKYSSDQSRASHKETTDSRNASAERINEAQIKAGKYNKGQFALSVDQALLKYGRSAAASAEILDSAYYTALANGDEVSAAIYKRRAEDARKRTAEDADNRKINPTAVNTPGVANLPANPPAAAAAPIAGAGGPTPASQPQAGRIRVIGPDGKAGTIPANQLEQALSQGYKKAQ